MSSETFPFPHTSERTRFVSPSDAVHHNMRPNRAAEQLLGLYRLAAFRFTVWGRFSRVLELRLRGGRSYGRHSDSVARKKWKHPWMRGSWPLRMGFATACKHTWVLARCSDSHSAHVCTHTHTHTHTHTLMSLTCSAVKWIIKTGIRVFRAQKSRTFTKQTQTVDCGVFDVAHSTPLWPNMQE